MQHPMRCTLKIDSVTAILVCCMGGQMKRREFIAFVGGATVWPLRAQGQQVASRSVGVLGVGSIESVRTSFARAQRRLAEMGHVEGRNLVLEYRGADNQEDRLGALAISEGFCRVSEDIGMALRDPPLRRSGQPSHPPFMTCGRSD